MRTRVMNEDGKVTVKRFAVPIDASPWACPKCGTVLTEGICASGQEEIADGSIVPCIRCGIEYALDADLRLRKPTPAQQLDVELYLPEVLEDITPNNSTCEDIAF